ncbi:Chromosome segregation protein sudA [Dictyocoela roeselum]|nr:Chromosome segregation protein sudA [Dictyocoela roeselum]
MEPDFNHEDDKFNHEFKNDNLNRDNHANTISLSANKSFIDPEQSFINNESVPLFSAIETSPQYSSIYKYLCKNTHLVTDLKAGALIARNKKINTVTLSGDFISKKGVMSGGFEKRDNLMRILKKSFEEIRTVEGGIEKVREEIKIVDEKNRNEEAKRNRCGNYNVNGSSGYTNDINYSDQTNVNDNLPALILFLEEKLKSKKSSISLPALKNKKIHLMQEISKIQIEIENLLFKRRKTELKRKHFEAEIEYYKAIAEKKNLENLINALKSEIFGLNEKLILLDNRNVFERAKKCDLSREVARNEMRFLTEKRDNLLKKIGVVKVDVQDLELDESDESEESCIKDRCINARDRDKNARDRCINARDRDKNARDRCINAIDRDENARDRDIKSQSINEKNNIKDLKKNIMKCKTITDVNILNSILFSLNNDLKNLPLANRSLISKYDDFILQKKRLLERKNDLEINRIKINELIGDLDRKKNSSIELTFSMISSQFTFIYKELTGCMAVLRKNRTGVDILIKSDFDHKDFKNEDMKDKNEDVEDKNEDMKDEIEDLENKNCNFENTDIKNNDKDGTFSIVNLNQLSGGQKTIIALTLLFSIQQVDPSPFYFFDEVDANLDGNARTKISAFLKKLKPQFVIATFKREFLSCGDKFFKVSFNKEQKMSDVEEIDREGADKELIC